MTYEMESHATLVSRPRYSSCIARWSVAVWKCALKLSLLEDSCWFWNWARWLERISNLGWFIEFDGHQLTLNCISVSPSNRACVVYLEFSLSSPWITSTVANNKSREQIDQWQERWIRRALMSLLKLTLVWFFFCLPEWSIGHAIVHSPWTAICPLIDTRNHRYNMLILYLSDERWYFPHNCDFLSCLVW